MQRWCLHEVLLLWKLGARCKQIPSHPENPPYLTPFFSFPGSFPSGVQTLQKTIQVSLAYTKDVILSSSEACGSQLAQSRLPKSCPSRSPGTDAQVFQQKVQECLQPQQLGSEPTPESEVMFLLTE